jgi:hypothetical protein
MSGMTIISRKYGRWCDWFMPRLSVNLLSTHAIILYHHPASSQLIPKTRQCNGRNQARAETEKESFQ